MSHLIETLHLYASTQPHKVALKSIHLQVNYAELQEKIEDFAAFLRSNQCKRLAIWQDNSINWVIWQLAAMQEKIVVIPIATFFSSEQIDNVLELTTPDLLVCDHKKFQLNEKYQKISGQFSYRRVSPDPLRENEFNDTALVTFTSGSTGKPKGVKISYDNIDNVCLGLRKVIQPLNISEHHCLLPLPVMLENIAGVFLPLLSGQTVVLAAYEETGLLGSSSIDFYKFSKYLSQENPQSLILTPELLKLLIHMRTQQVEMTNLKFIAVGGAKVSSNLIQQAHSLGLPVYEGYGLSECGSVVSLNLPGESRNGSVGRPLPHVEIKVSDQGEILIDGSVMQGYLGTEAYQGKFYYSGDHGYLDKDGFLYITGRKKNVQINSFGRNINPEWIESEIVSLPTVLRALIFTDEVPALIALIQFAPNVKTEQLEQDIRKLNNQLPDYAQICQFYEITPQVIKEEDLLTGNGKLRRQACYDYYSKQINEFYIAREHDRQECIIDVF